MSLFKILEILYVSLLIIEKQRESVIIAIIVLLCFTDMEATYAEYEEWSEQGVAETVAHQYKKASQEMLKRKPLEESMVPDLHGYF